MTFVQRLYLWPLPHYAFWNIPMVYKILIGTFDILHDRVKGSEDSHVKTLAKLMMGR